jgi:hypothetical protein
MQLEQKIIRTNYSEIFLDKEGILWLRPDENAYLDLEEVTACFKAYAELGVHKGNKVLQVIDAQRNVTMEKEGRDYAALHGNDYFIASAIISTHLSVRLIVNFFNLFYKSGTIPFKLFSNEEPAKRWLSGFLT